MGGGAVPTEKKHKNNRYLRIFCANAPYHIKFQVPGSSGSLVLT